MNYKKLNNFFNSFSFGECANKKIIHLGSIFTMFATVLVYGVYFELWYIASMLSILFLIVERSSLNKEDKGFFLLSIGTLIVITIGQSNILLAMIALIALLTLFSNISSMTLNIVILSKFVIIFSFIIIGVVHFITIFRNAIIPLVIFLVLFAFVTIYLKYWKLNLQNKYTGRD